MSFDTMSRQFTTVLVLILCLVWYIVDGRYTYFRTDNGRASVRLDRTTGQTCVRLSLPNSTAQAWWSCS
jgi:hypothetical protein